MHGISANPVQLFLPLLNHRDDKVRRQALSILLGVFGKRSLAYLQRLLEDADCQTRRQAQTALSAFSGMLSVNSDAQVSRPIYIECLGGLRVFIHSQEVLQYDWMQPGGGRAGLRKVQDAVAYLAHCGRRGATRREIAELVWGCTAHLPNVERNLTWLCQMLIKVGGNELTMRALLTEGDRCGLVPEMYHLDAQLFEQTFDFAHSIEASQHLADAVPLYRQALHLYGGTYMADVAWSQDWPQARRDRLANNAVIAAERLARHAYKQRDDLACIGYCRQGLVANPAADEVHVWLLQTYARLRRWPELEHSFRRYVRAARLDPGTAEYQCDAVVHVYHQWINNRT